MLFERAFGVQAAVHSMHHTIFSRYLTRFCIPRRSGIHLAACARGSILDNKVYLNRGRDIVMLAPPGQVQLRGNSPGNFLEDESESFGELMDELNLSSSFTS